MGSLSEIVHTSVAVQVDGGGSEGTGEPRRESENLSYKISHGYQLIRLVSRKCIASDEIKRSLFINMADSLVAVEHASKHEQEKTQRHLRGPYQSLLHHSNTGHNTQPPSESRQSPHTHGPEASCTPW
jgi:hypothetical protein